MVKRTEELKGYLSSKDIGASLGYTHDYISRLCRQGKMVGIRKGREWFVLPEELEAFKIRHEQELIEKKKELSKKFSQIRLQHEAKKRQAKQQSQVQDVPIEIPKKPIKLSLPKEIVAMAVFALLLVSPTLFAGQQSSTTFSPLYRVSQIVDDGIQDMIYSQSTAIDPIFDVITSQGTNQLASVIEAIPTKTFIGFKKIGDGYLVLYTLQGEAIYESCKNLSTFGNKVLGGYELIGESFFQGSKDMINIYSEILRIKPRLETSSNSVTAFTANVQEGAQYAGANFSENIFVKLTSQIHTAISYVSNNISANIISMKDTISDISRTMTAYAGSLFNLHFIK